MINPELPLVLDPVAAGRVRGEVVEEHVAAVLTADLMPWWFLRARFSTEHEDAYEGFDLVIYTRDVGRILLQVKSSEHGRIKWEEESRIFGRPYRIHCVVVRPHTPPEVVLGRVLAACVTAREEAKAARCCADHRGLCRTEARAA